MSDRTGAEAAIRRALRIAGYNPGDKHGFNLAAQAYQLGATAERRQLLEFAEREKAVIPCHDPRTGAHVGYVPFTTVLNEHLAERHDLATDRGEPVCTCGQRIDQHPSADA